METIQPNGKRVSRILCKKGNFARTRNVNSSATTMEPDRELAC